MSVTTVGVACRFASVVMGGGTAVLRSGASRIGVPKLELGNEVDEVLRYTACPKIGDAPMALFLAAEAIAYEVSLTGNQEHLRILREGVPAALPKGSGGDIGKSLAQFIHFAPYALSALEADEEIDRDR